MITRRDFFEKYCLRFAATLALLGLIVYTLYHVFGSSSGSLITTPACKITDKQIIRGEAYLFRDESVVLSSAEGVVNPLVENGTKIGKGTTFADVWYGYSAEERKAVQIELDYLNRMIGVTEDSLSQTGTTLSAALQYRNQATAEYLAIREAVTAGKLSSVAGLEERMLTMLNCYSAIVNDKSALTRFLAELRQSRLALLRGGVSSFQNDQSSGYFYDRTYVDGYESVFAPSRLTDMTVADFERMTETEPLGASSAFAVGKLVYDSNWHYAIGFDASAGELFSEGETYEISFPDRRDSAISMTCTRVITDGGERAVVILSTNEMPQAFDFLRARTVEITVGSCEGYHVPDSALHELNGVSGVYVFEDSTVRFRLVKILYRGDGYSIVAEQGDMGESYLALNDLMITAGDDLYDGRVYR